MKPDITIRSEIEDYIRRNAMNLQGLSLAAGMNKGILSAIINRNPPKAIAVKQLDLITSGMNLPEGALYELYIDECLVTNAPNWRRLRPFLQRCAELEKYDCIEEILHRLTEDLSFIPGIFETAEMLFEQGLSKAALLLYKCVAEGEKFQHSERLAICRYRLFSLSLGQDQQANLRAAVHFEPYVNRLSEEVQLDALKELMNLYFSIGSMDEVVEISKMLVFRAECQHNIEHGKAVRTKRKTKYPVLVYKAYGYLMRAAAYGRCRNYAEALKYTLKYTDMDWSEEQEEDVHTHIAMFKSWGELNSYMIKIQQGEWDMLPQYVSYLNENVEEVLAGLLVITEAANRFEMDVDDVLTLFEDQISSYRESMWVNGVYSKQLNDDRYLKLSIELASYYLRRQHHKIGVIWIIHSLRTSIRIKSDTSIIKCMKVFEKFRHVASVESQIEYKNLVNEVQTLDEEKHCLSANGIYYGDRV